MRADEAPFFEPQENWERAFRQDVPIARVAGDFANFAVLVSLVVDCSTEREFMQNTLFMF
ncbi:hypothetical protein ACMU_16815 [Actibacterium mucosum KCTC 23349]|uniref:Uncharacterized protein n=1 Tax=Actibacterium mucosum KCTC 23349 TaxID=1454373 RepID=A0A037ZGW5_9RHOB|nr:hypothetical protein ACMU_16815 [Actibacterium mucosum KCTC 23349]